MPDSRDEVVIPPMAPEEYRRLHHRFDASMHECVRAFFLKHDADAADEDIASWVSDTFAAFEDITFVERNFVEGETIRTIKYRRSRRGMFDGLH